MKLITSFLMTVSLISLFFILDINNVQASTTVTLNPIADTYVDQTSPGTNYGSLSSMVAGRTDNSTNKEAFLKFDLSSIPALSQVDSATLYLHQVTGAPCDASSDNVYINSVNADWVEGTLTWSNRQMSYGGANGYLNMVCSDSYLGSDLKYSVQQMVDGAVTNYGFRIGAGLNGGWTRTFDTREAAGNAPYLEVVYSASTDVTGPTISAVSATPQTTTATVSWNTNEYATSEVRMATTEAGLSSGYASSQSSSYVSMHSLLVSGLTSQTLYYVRIFSTDVHGNSTSQDTTVTTLASPTAVPPTPTLTPVPPTATNTPAPTQIAPTTTAAPVHTQVPPTPTPTKTSSQNKNITPTPSPTLLPSPSISPTLGISITPTPDTTGSPTPTVGKVVTSTANDDSNPTTNALFVYVLGGLVIIIMGGIGGLIYYLKRHPGTSLKSLLTGIFKKPLPKDENV